MDLSSIGVAPKIENPVFFAGRSRVLKTWSVNTSRFEILLFPLVFRHLQPRLSVSARKSPFHTVFPPSQRGKMRKTPPRWRIGSCGSQRSIKYGHRALSQRLPVLCLLPTQFRSTADVTSSHFRSISSSHSQDAIRRFNKAVHRSRSPNRVRPPARLPPRRTSRRCFFRCWHHGDRVAQSRSLLLRVLRSRPRYP